MFNLAEAWALRTYGGNPCSFVQKYKEKRQERFLTEEEFAQLGRVLAEVEAEGAERPAAPSGLGRVSEVAWRDRIGATIGVGAFRHANRPHRDQS